MGGSDDDSGEMSYYGKLAMFMMIRSRVLCIQQVAVVNYTGLRNSITIRWLWRMEPRFYRTEETKAGCGASEGIQ